MIFQPLNILDVTPAKAGAYPEMIPLPQGRRLEHCGCAATSGWVPAFAGMTPEMGMTPLTGANP